MNKIDRLIEELCPDGVEFSTLKKETYISIGEFVHKNKQNCDSKYPVYNGGREPTGYYEKFNNTGDKIIISARGANAGFVNRISRPYWAGNSCYSIGMKESSKLKWDFAFYYLKNSENNLINIQQKGGIPAVSKKQIETFIIPIPPIDIQKEIVSILDRFTTLEAELEAELEARKKQYEYYRDELLTFGDDVEFRNLEISQLGKTITGRTPSKAQSSFWGEGINFITPSDMKSDAKILKETERSLSSNIEIKKAFKNNILPPKSILVSCIGSDMGKTIMNANQSVSNQQINAIIIEMQDVLPDYIYHYLASKKEYLQMLGRSSGGTMPIINKTNFMNIEIPVPFKNGKPNFEKQIIIVSILDKFDDLVNDITVGLPAEIEARRKQYEYYRDKLLSFKEKK